MLVVVGGLPGVGKTTIAAALARRTGANFVRIDAIETGIALASGSSSTVGASGYVVGHQVVRSMLVEGMDVIVDAVNPVAAARQGWIDLGVEFGVDVLTVEVVCSDVDLHRRRVESRSPNLPGHVMPTWEDVTRLSYEPWPEADIVVDSADVERDLVEVIASRLRRPGALG
ncbi:MAG: AAA family ATPase [Ilumatobacter sp.]|uniref:AAA family ATPase n=1 Tax=Ilumatobacter sp. TaxID=1967498 RepID=UPI00329939DE